jgi:FkbH-like protein
LASAERALGEGRQRDAASALRIAIGSDPSHAVAHRVAALAERLDPTAAGLERVRVAFLSDHTAGPLPHLLTAHALLSGFAVEPYVPAFDAWLEAVADPASDLRAFAPDVVILDVRLDRVAPVLVERALTLDERETGDQVEAAAQAVAGAIDALRAWSSAPVLVHRFPRPRWPVLGIHDTLAPGGQLGAVSRVNARLQEVARSRETIQLIDVDQLALEEGDALLDARLFAVAKQPYTSVMLTRLALEYAKYLRALRGRARKVLVIDADNTLWGGVVGEDGLDGIRLDADSGAAGHLALQRYVAALGARGVVLVLLTANERRDVDEVFAKRPEMILRPKEFAMIVADWKDKAESCVEIARSLDLSLDAFVFVDDDPVQCARVRAALPDVIVVELSGEPLGFVATLARGGWFDTLTITEEDRRRNELYRSDMTRRELEQVAVSADDFVASLGVTLHIRRLDRGALARAASLTQRTNQFNLTSRRYTEAELAARLDAGWTGFTVRLVDRFGDIGVIGLALIERSGHVATIDTFLVSCRALRRRVEDALLSVVVDEALRSGASEIVGLHVPTPKNGQTTSFYPERGFAPAGRSEGETRWGRSAPIRAPSNVTIAREGEGWA